MDTVNDSDLKADDLQKFLNGSKTMIDRREFWNPDGWLLVEDIASVRKQV